MDKESFAPKITQSEGARINPDAKAHRPNRQRRRDISMEDLIDLAVSLSKNMHTLKFVAQMAEKKRTDPLASLWMENRQVMSVLKLSKKTLQTLRDKGILPFSRLNGKLYYKTTDIFTMLESNYENERRQKMKKG